MMSCFYDTDFGKGSLTKMSPDELFGKWKKS